MTQAAISDQQILELHDQGWTGSEVAKQVDLTVRVLGASWAPRRHRSGPPSGTPAAKALISRTLAPITLIVSRSAAVPGLDVASRSRSA